MDNSCDGVSGGTHIRTYCDCEVYFLSLTGCFNNMLGESLVAWQPPAVNMQAVLPWEQDDWSEVWDTKLRSSKQWWADIWGQHHAIQQVSNFFCTWTHTLKDAYSECTLFKNVSAVLMTCVCFRLCMHAYVCAHVGLLPSLFHTHMLPLSGSWLAGAPVECF